MDKSRNYILDRLKSKRTSIEEFNYDSLQAPPLAMFLSPFDIQELRNIATSLKYSAKPEVRYAEIDKVCRRRGLVKFAAGTNRVVYRHPEFPDYLFKIAADNVGMRDNPAEFRNQMLLKPFVAKCFEISPCGTVAIVEKVNPITSREEFLSVADDVFELLNEFIIGHYVVADCGSRFFMNFGVRATFGVVVIDYPYLYELDGDKLFCSKPDQNSISGKCDGVIDYDDGFNFLHCTKCGAIYKAKELEKKIADNEIIIKRQGEIKMKAIIKGGTNNVTKTVNTAEETNSPLLNSLKDKVVKATKNQIKNDSKKAKLSDIVTNNNEVTLKVKSINKEANVVAEVEAKEVVESKVEKVIEKSAPINKSVNGVSTEVKRDNLRSPITISDDIKKEAQEEAAKKEVLEVSPVEAIEKAMKTIVDNMDRIDISTIKEDTLSRVFDTVMTMLPETASTYALLAKHLYKLFDELECEEFVEASKNENIAEICDRLLYQSVEINNVDVDGSDLSVDYSIINKVCGEDDGEGNTEMVEIFRTKNQNLILKGVYDFDEVESAESTNVEKEEVVEESNEDSGYRYESITFYEGKVMNITEINPDEDSHEILVAVDVDGNYVTTADKAIVAIDVVDKKDLSSSMFVSKKWAEEMEHILDEEYNVEDEEDNSVEEVEYEEPSGSSAMDEFLEKEEV